MDIIWQKDAIQRNRYTGFVKNSNYLFEIDLKDGKWRLLCPDGSLTLLENPTGIREHARNWLNVASRSYFLSLRQNYNL
ncbi:MAG: hypothetical protein ACI9J3_001015 [Parvicellaceae bacterium]|jgi:hypothetical protein